MWDQIVPGCFGGTSLFFAGHTADEARAFEWLQDLRARSIGWTAAAAQLEAYLKSRNAAASHIEAQLKEAEKYLKPWLLD